MGMKDIQLFVSVYKDHADSAGKVTFPVSAGAALYGEGDPVLSLRDDTGENISASNPQYCELTVQYWAWKNRSFDVGGLMHQRRYFDLSRVFPVQHGKKPSSSRPYRIFDVPDEKTVSRLGLRCERVSELTDVYPIIAPLRENIYQSVRDYYNRNDRQKHDDISLLLQIIGNSCPEYLESAQRYFSESYAYFCNMMIMDRKQFCSYSQWLFSVLAQYDRMKPKELFYPREQGKLAERLFGVYMTYILSETDIPCAEAPRAHFCRLGGATPDNASFNKKLYALCPPGSRRRGILRRLKK